MLRAWLPLRGNRSDLNVRGAYLHMAVDAAVSLGVAVAGLAIMATGWTWLDALVSLVIVAMVVAGTWVLLRESVDLLLSAVPSGVDPAAVTRLLGSRPGVSDVHDLHIWGMSTTECALTAHLAMPGGYPGDAVLDDIVAELRHHYSIDHATLQVEHGTFEHVCALRAAA